jgi:hypothetical protein
VAQHDYNIANQSGLAFRQDLNNALAAIVSQNSGATEPSTIYAYQLWADTTAGLLKQRNAANTAWVTIGALGSANLGLVPTTGGSQANALGTAALPSYSFSGDTNTGIYSPGADQVGIATNGVVRLTTTTAQFTGTLPWRGQNGSVTAPAFSFSGDTDTGIYWVSADTVAITTGGTQASRWDASGNQTNVGDITAPSFNGGPLAGARNRIIGGCMRIAQRGTAAVTSSGSFPVDRFTLNFVTTGALSSSQSTDAPAGFSNSLLVSVTTADTSIAATEQAHIAHVIEGLNTDDFGFGAAGAQTVTLSFWVKSSVTGTYGVALLNSALNRSYVATYTISAANTWERKSVTIAGDTSGTWLKDNGAGIRIRWGLAAGTNFHQAAGSWGTGNAVSTSAQANVLGTVSNSFLLTGVQLESGSVATPFERRSYGQELSLCQRYYQLIGFGTSLQVSSGQTYGGNVQFNWMRALPTYAFISANNATNFQSTPNLTDVWLNANMRWTAVATSTTFGTCSYYASLSSEL